MTPDPYPVSDLAEVVREHQVESTLGAFLAPRLERADESRGHRYIALAPLGFRLEPPDSLLVRRVFILALERFDSEGKAPVQRGSATLAGAFYLRLAACFLFIRYSRLLIKTLGPFCARSFHFG
jgi:hypothetical protein